MTRKTPDESQLREIDSLAERAYSLRFINLRAALELAGTALQSAEDAAYPAGIARALVAAGAARCRTMDLAGAAADLQRALDIFETHPDPVGRARALSWQGSIALRRADYSGSMRIWAEALAAFRAAGDRQGEGDVLHKIGTLHSYLGDFVAALETLEESRQIKEELEDQHGLALCVSDVGVALFELGERESARQSFEEALAFYRRTGATSAVLANLVNLGLCCSELGDYECAIASLQECLSLSREAGERWPEARALFNLAEVYYSMGDPQSALTHFQAAEELSRVTDDRVTEIGVILGTGRTLLLLGEVEPALERLSTALEAAEGAGIQRFVAEAHQALAEAYEAGGNLEAAIRHLRAVQRARDKVQQAGATLRTQHREALAELKRTQQETELQVLKAQLQPHFLFNALNSLSALIERNPSEANRMVIQLGDLLRLALVQSSDQRTTLDAEIEFVTAYLKLEQVRYKNAFTYTIEVAPELAEIEVPHLILQPLAENSIRHGFARSTGEARIEIRGEKASADRLLLTVRDTGVGLPEGWSLQTSGVGLRNTRLRLQRLYGSDQEFRIGPHPAGGTLVEIALPIPR